VLPEKSVKYFQTAYSPLAFSVVWFGDSFEGGALGARPCQSARA
jgi:hypothetical protein